MSLEVVTQFPVCNEYRIKQLMHLRVPRLGVTEDFTDASTSMGSGFGGSWPLESKRAPRNWDPVASWLTGPGSASRN
jgi:hypothetical protein